MTFLRPDVHVVRDTYHAKVFRRRLNCPDIVTFFSLETGMWILAYWINRRLRMVDEIEDLGSNFELITKELVQQIVQCWGTIDWGAKKERILSKFRDRERKQTDSLMEQQERWDWLKKRMDKPVPYAFSSPMIQE